MTLRAGSVASGLIAAVHRDAIDAAPLAGVTDCGSGRGAALAAELATTGAGDLDAFMARDDIDVVTVAGPIAVHPARGRRSRHVQVGRDHHRGVRAGGRRRTPRRTRVAAPPSRMPHEGPPP